MIYKTSLVEPLSTNFPHYLGGRWASGSEHPGFAFSALVFNLLSKRCKANSGPVLSGALFITAYCPNISVPKKDKDDCRIGKTLPFHNPWPCRVSSNFNKKRTSNVHSRHHGCLPFVARGPESRHTRAINAPAAGRGISHSANEDPHASGACLAPHSAADLQSLFRALEPSHAAAVMESGLIVKLVNGVLESSL